MAQPIDILWADIDTEKEFPAVRPKLAHYTSIDTAEKILRNREIWLSSPLFMNDLEELRFGLLRARDRFETHDGIRNACSNQAEYAQLHSEFHRHFGMVESNEVLRIFIFCLSLHDADSTDGLLSMWRGYGSNGQGVAIVFDLGKIEAVESSPFVLARVQYLSTSERVTWIDKKLDQFAEIVASAHPQGQQLEFFIENLIRRFLLAALFSKHRGFHEEREWRLVYLPDRDRTNRLAPMFGYLIGKNGVEPKLKYRPAELGPEIDGKFDFDTALHCLILGPAVSNAVSLATFKGMLDMIRPGLSPKATVSTTPYRILG